jgi:hypothetical protein
VPPLHNITPVCGGRAPLDPIAVSICVGSASSVPVLDLPPFVNCAVAANVNSDFFLVSLLKSVINWNTVTDRNPLAANLVIINRVEDPKLLISSVPACVITTALTVPHLPRPALLLDCEPDLWICAASVPPLPRPALLLECDADLWECAASVPLLPRPRLSPPLLIEVIPPVVTCEIHVGPVDHRCIECVPGLFICSPRALRRQCGGRLLLLYQGFM